MIMNVSGFITVTTLKDHSKKGYLLIGLLLMKSDLFFSSVQAREDWKYVAMVVDRIFLIIFLCGVFAGTITIMLEAPLAKEFFAQAFI